MKVLDLPEVDRPRERLLSRGAAALSDRELLALVLGSGLPGCDAIELAAVLIGEVGRSLSAHDRRSPRPQAVAGHRRREGSPRCRRVRACQTRRRSGGSASDRWLGRRGGGRRPVLARPPAGAGRRCRVRQLWRSAPRGAANRRQR